MVGIVSYGVAIPKYRLKTEDIATAWGKQTAEVASGLGIQEKAVPGVDEDAVTLAVEAGYRALAYAGIDAEKIGAVFIGSESHPYAVNPSSTIVGEYLGIGHEYMASDLEFACKAGSTALQIVAEFVENKTIAYGLAIGADTAQAKPHDVLEYTAGAGGAAYILGNKKSEILAELDDFVSYSSDTPDFWRRDGISYPSHGGRFTGEPAYFTHVMRSSTLLLQKHKLQPADFTYAVFHMPNGKFPQQAAKRLGFTPEQLKPSFLAPRIGNPYSASSLLGLAAVLDQAKPGERIFMTSYGSGAGSDSFIFTVKKKRKKSVLPTVEDLLADKTYISYTEYLKKTKKI